MKKTCHEENMLEKATTGVVETERETAAGTQTEPGPQTENTAKYIVAARMPIPILLKPTSTQPYVEGADDLSITDLIQLSRIQCIISLQSCRSCFERIGCHQVPKPQTIDIDSNH